MWDARTCQAIAYYSEHQKRAWSVDFSRVDPAKFASGSDDCSVKLWSIAEVCGILFHAIYGDHRFNSFLHCLLGYCKIPVLAKLEFPPPFRVMLAANL